MKNNQYNLEDLFDGPSVETMLSKLTCIKMEQNETMSDALDMVRSDEALADLEAQKGEEVTLLSDTEIIQLLSDTEPKQPYEAGGPLEYEEWN